MYILNAYIAKATAFDTHNIKYRPLKQGFGITTETLDLSIFEVVAHVTADYFGGGGYQTAELFINGKSVYFASSEEEYCTPINNVLLQMGVIVESGKDLFDTLELGKERDNEWT